MIDDKKLTIKSARLGLNIANGVLDALSDEHFSFNENNLELLDNEIFIRESTKQIISQIIGTPCDSFEYQKKKIEHFYKNVFNFSIDWTKVEMPQKVEGLYSLGYISKELTEEIILSKYCKMFGNNSIESKHFSDISKMIKKQQSRPREDYLFFYRNGIEVDPLHLNKCYLDFYQDGNTYMIPMEGLLTSFYHRFETGNMWDVKGETIFHAVNSNGLALSMDCDTNQRLHLSIDSHDKSGQPSNPCGMFGPRQISL